MVKIGHFPWRSMHVSYLLETLCRDKRALFKLNCSRLLGWPRMYTSYPSAPKCYVTRTCPFLLVYFRKSWDPEFFLYRPAIVHSVDRTQGAVQYRYEMCPRLQMTVSLQNMCLDKTVTASLGMEQQLCMNMKDQKLKEAKLLLTQTLCTVSSIQRL